MRVLFILMVVSCVAGCGSEYYWNQDSGKAHEGRCYKKVPGYADIIVESKKCGK